MKVLLLNCIRNCRTSFSLPFSLVHATFYFKGSQKARVFIPLLVPGFLLFLLRADSNVRSFTFNSVHTRSLSPSWCITYTCTCAASHTTRSKLLIRLPIDSALLACARDKRLASVDFSFTSTTCWPRCTCIINRLHYQDTPFTWEKPHAQMFSHDSDIVTHRSWD